MNDFEKIMSELRRMRVPAAGSTPAGACPDPNDLARFLDGGGSEADRGDMESHIARCTDCMETLKVFAGASCEEPLPLPQETQATRAEALALIRAGTEQPSRQVRLRSWFSETIEALKGRPSLNLAAVGAIAAAVIVAVVVGDMGGLLGGMPEQIDLRVVSVKGATVRSQPSSGIIGGDVYSDERVRVDIPLREDDRLWTALFLGPDGALVDRIDVEIRPGQTSLRTGSERTREPFVQIDVGYDAALLEAEASALLRGAFGTVHTVFLFSEKTLDDQAIDALTQDLAEAAAQSDGPRSEAFAKALGSWGKGRIERYGIDTFRYVEGERG